MDDASGDIDAQTGVTWWKKSFDHNIRYKRNKENLGFGGNCNAGAEIAEGEILVFLSNDVIIRGDFLTPIKDILTEGNPEALVGGQIIDWAGGWNEINYNGSKRFIPYLAGWLLACRKETWKELGGFDPRYGVYDYEDVDLSTTAISKGIPLIVTDSSHLQHLSGATIASMKVDRRSQTLKNQKIYHEKWQGQWEKIFERLDHVR